MDGTPSDFLILGVADVRAWGTGGNGGATMGIYTNNGTVFNAATTDWPRVLRMGEPSVVQITRNVIDRFMRRASS
jgi:hypothetical protein